MQVRWSYFGCSKEDEERLQRQWEEGQRRLRSRVDALGDEPAELNVVVYRQDEAPQWKSSSSRRRGGPRGRAVSKTQTLPETAVPEVVRLRALP